MALIDDAKIAIRISHTKLDTEVQANIDTAKAEMKRAGILAAAVVDTDPLIAEAIKTYCKYVFASDMKQKEGFFESWQYQIDCLRKSTGYGVDVDV